MNIWGRNYHGHWLYLASQWRHMSVKAHQNHRQLHCFSADCPRVVIFKIEDFTLSQKYNNCLIFLEFLVNHLSGTTTDLGLHLLETHMWRLTRRDFEKRTGPNDSRFRAKTHLEFCTISRTGFAGMNEIDRMMKCETMDACNEFVQNLKIGNDIL